METIYPKPLRLISPQELEKTLQEKETKRCEGNMFFVDLKKYSPQISIEEDKLIIKLEDKYETTSKRRNQ